MKLPNKICSVDPESVMQDENSNLDDCLNLSSEVEADFQESLDGCAAAKTRLSCFAHSLQLVVRNGLTEYLYGCVTEYL